MKTVGAFFCGMGGFCLGFEANGFRTAWANDFEENVALTYRHNFPDTKFYFSDIAKLNSNDLEPVDVVHGGFPCQPFSNAGSRSGFNDPKGRGQLFHVMMDKIEAMETLPKVLVFENVPNFLIGESGIWFEDIKNRIKSAGYWFAKENAIIIDLRKHGGLPQRRERLFMFAIRKDIADFNPFNSFNHADKISSLETLLENTNDKNPSLYLDVESKYHEEMWHAAVGTKNPVRPYQLIQYRKTWPRIIEPGICPTLTHNMGTGGHNVPFYYEKEKKQFRRLSVEQCLALQGFPSDYSFPTEVTKKSTRGSHQYAMIGNAVSPRISSLIAQNIVKFLERHHEIKLAI